MKKKLNKQQVNGVVGGGDCNDVSGPVEAKTWSGSKKPDNGTGRPVKDDYLTN